MKPEKFELKVLQCPAGHKLQDFVSVVNERRWCDYCDEIRLYEGTRVHTCVECNWIICSDCYHRRNRPSSNPSAVLLVASPGSNAKSPSTANMIASPPPPPVRRMDLQSRIKKLIGLGPAPKRKELKTVSTPDRIGKDTDQIRFVLLGKTNLQRHCRDFMHCKNIRSTSLSPSSSGSRTPRGMRTRYERRERWQEERR